MSFFWRIAAMIALSKAVTGSYVKHALNTYFAGLVALVSALFLLASQPASAQSYPAGFSASTVVNVGGPTAIAFLPDKRMLITTKGGSIRLFNATAPAGSQLSTVLTFATDGLGSNPQTCTPSEAGVLGIAVDPDFSIVNPAAPTNNFFYVFYTARNGSDCGTPNYGTSYNATNQRVNRVSRFTFNPQTNTIAPSSELILVDRMPARGGNHNAGDVHFGKDGLLYISIGDGGTSWTGAGGAGDNYAARDRNILTGKILRITKTGDIPAANPFQGAGTGRCNVLGTHAGTGHCQETFAWGLRNPFRFAMDPNAAGTRFYINDVGQDQWEEVSESQAGADYGWNCREGANQFRTQNQCNPTPQGMVDPVYQYRHGVQIPGTTSPTNCNSITGGAFVPNGVWPATYDNTYLVADYVCGVVVRIATNGTPAAPVTTAANFASSLGGSSATSLRFGPDGNGTALYMTTFAGGGSIQKIVYTPASNQAPTVSNLVASPASSASVPLTTTLTATASDPENNPITYVWNFGDTTTQTTTTNSVQKTYNTVGVYTVSVIARDSFSAESAPRTTIVRAGNTPPVASITAPTVGQQFTVGESITLTGSATDAQDGTISTPASFSWRVILHHDTHTHPYFGPSTGNSINFLTPAPEDLLAANNSYLEVELTVTDSGGLPHTVTRELQPQKRTLSLQSVPSGRKLEVLGNVLTTPINVVVWPNWPLTLNARDQSDNASGYRFSSWSDGGNRSKTYVAPSTNATITANFTTGSFVPSIDIDNNGAFDAATDGVILLRYLVGIRGSNLVTAALGVGATRTSPADIESFLATAVASMNVDGRAGVAATTDGLIIMRYLLGLDDAQLLPGTGALVLPADARNNLRVLTP